MSVTIYLFIVINKMGYEYSSMGFPVWKYEKCLPVLKDNCGRAWSVVPLQGRLTHLGGIRNHTSPAVWANSWVIVVVRVYVRLRAGKLQPCVCKATGVLIKILKSIKPASGLLWLCCNNETR